MYRVRAAYIKPSASARAGLDRTRHQPPRSPRNPSQARHSAGIVGGRRGRDEGRAPVGFGGEEIIEKSGLPGRRRRFALVPSWQLTAKFDVLFCLPRTLPSLRLSARCHPPRLRYASATLTLGEPADDPPPACRYHRLAVP